MVLRIYVVLTCRLFFLQIFCKASSKVKWRLPQIFYLASSWLNKLACYCQLVRQNHSRLDLFSIQLYTIGLELGSKQTHLDFIYIFFCVQYFSRTRLLILLAQRQPTSWLFLTGANQRASSFSIVILLAIYLNFQLILKRFSIWIFFPHSKRNFISRHNGIWLSPAATVEAGFGLVRSCPPAPTWAPCGCNQRIDGRFRGGQ